MIVLSTTLFCVFYVTGLSTSCLANEKSHPLKIRVGGSVRLRFEELDNFNIKKFGSGTHDGFLLWRTRIDSQFSKGKDHLYLQIQDNRFTNSDFSVDDFPDKCPYQNFLDLRQAYFERKSSAENSWELRLGRQAICYRDNRIFGPGDWGNTGRYTWDGLKIQKKTCQKSVDFLVAKRILYDPRYFDNEHYDFTTLACYVQDERNEGASDLFWLYKNDENDIRGENGIGPERRHTLGFYKTIEKQYWNFESTFTFQIGEHGADSVKAHGMHIGVKFKPSSIKNLTLGIDYAMASGDSSPADGKVETFDGVFGAVDKYYGRMNLVSWMNIENWQFTLSTKLRKTMHFSASAHWFHLNEEKDCWYYRTGKPVAGDPLGLSGDYIGREIDLILKWQITSELELLAGKCHFSAGTFAKNMGSYESAGWSFIQLTSRF